MNVKSMGRWSAVGGLIGVVLVGSPVGAQVPECLGMAATIVGTAGMDVIEGTGGADVIAAGDGADVVSGRGGGDVICGGPGSDQIQGGRGDDRISGGRGNDAILGGRGNDAVHGNGGDDRLEMLDAALDASDGEGNDRVRGGAGVDEVRSEPGDDRLHGGPGSDFLNFDSADAGVIVDLTAGTATGDGDDRLTAIENVFGSPFDDSAGRSDSGVRNVCLRFGAGGARWTT